MLAGIQADLTLNKDSCIEIFANDSFDLNAQPVCLDLALTVVSC